ncbi:MFS transporter [Phenylobacterium immobile]|uniref:MFS transporter n=1 Tax=Phenylobacterium immobile TaxID=21 RepID=UPI000ABF26EF|nr:MFS transporter [Phenylobacterium immobile]
MADSTAGEFKAGWPTVLAAAVGACSGLTGLAFYTFGLFVKPLSEAFGWSRGQITLGMSFITLGTVISAPLAGWLIDRYGVRRIAAPSLLGLGLAYALTAQVGPALWTFYAACMGIALLGCATSPISWTRAVNLQFSRGRGLALGLTLLGSATAGVVGAPAVQMVIVDHGWRAGYMAVAGFAVLAAFPVVALLLGRGATRTSADNPTARAGMTLPEALRTPTFWMIGGAILLLITAQSGVIVHLVPLLTDRGLPRVEAAGLAGVMGAAIFISRGVIGAMLDRFSPPLVAGVSLLAPVGAAVILAVCGADRLGLLAAVILLGLGAGAEIDFLSFFTVRHFGLRAYGRIYGWLFAMFSIGNGVGAPLVGAIYDRLSYQPALWGAAVLFACGAGLFAALAWRPVWATPTSQAL